MPTWSAKDAVNRLNTHAAVKSTGNCAAFVRQAIAAGGIHVPPTRYAKDYGLNLVAAGFAEIVPRPATYEAGDIVVIQTATGHPAGHMAMYNGQSWISDFKQNGLYPGETYRKEQPDYVIYRYAQQ